MKQNDLIFNAFPSSCILLKPANDQLRVIKINKKFHSLVSQNKDEILDKPISLFIPTTSTSWVTFNQSIDKVLKTGKTNKIKNILFNIPTGSGKLKNRYFDIENIPIKEEEGKPDYILSTLTRVSKEVNGSNYKPKVKKAFHQIEESHFIENHDDGLYCLDLQGNFTSFNQGLVQLSDIPKAELKKTSFFPFCAPHHREKIIEHFIKVTTGKSQKFEADFISAKGRKLVLQVTLAPLFSKGKITGAYGIARDITLLKKYQNEVEKNEKKFKALIQEGSDLIGILNKEGIYKFVSDTSLPLLGIDPTDLIGKNAFDFIHPEDKNRVFSAFLELENNHQLELSPFRFKNSRDQWRWIETTATNLYEDPSIEGIVVNSRDITEKINSQKALVESEERYRSFFENSLDAILVTEPNGKILAANPSACEMFQRTEREICKVGRSGLVDTSDPRLAEALKIRKETGKANLTLGYIRKDGTKFQGEVTSSIFRNSEGREISSVIIRDISEKLRVEEKLKKSREKYKFLFEYNPLPNWIFDNNTLQIIDVNEAALIHYGFSRKEFLKMKITDLRPGRNSTEIKRLINTPHTENNIIKFGSVLHRKKDKTIITVEVTGFRFDLNYRDCTLVVCQDITEREAILQKLKDREIKLQNAQEIARLGYWEMNFNKKSLYWTKEVYNIWGKDAKEFSPTPQKFMETIHPDDLKEFERKLEKALQGDENLDTEHRILLPDGTIKWVHEKGKIIKGENGEPYCFEGTVQDITDRKKNLQELMLSEARLANILNSQTNYLVRTDLNGNYTYCNSKFQEEFSWIFPKKKLIGNHVSTTIKSYHLNKVQEILNQCLKNPNSVIHVEIDEKTKDGNVKHTLWDFICLTGPNGEPLEFQCAGIDITERKKAEEQIIETNMRYDLVTKATSDAIWDWQCKTDKLFWGEGFKSLFGYESEVWSPKSQAWEDKIHPEDAERVFKKLRDVLKGDLNNWEEEYRFRKSDNSYASVIDRGFIIRDNKNKAIRMVGAMQDITERKAALQKLTISESRFRSLIQSQTNYVIRVDMEGNYSYCNEKFCNDFGWLHLDHKLEGQNTLKSIMEYHHTRVWEISKQCLLHPNKVFQVEIDKPAKNGGVKTTLWDFICITDSAGDPSEIQCIGIDISERVKAEKELIESNTRYELVTKATSDAIWDWNLTTGEMFIGDGFQHLFGYHSNQSVITIDNWAENVHSEDFFRVTNNIYKIIEGKKNKFSSTYRYKKANGDYAYVSDRALIVRDENLKAVRIVGAMQDISEKKRLENLLNKATSLARIGSYEVNIATSKIYWSSMTKEIHEVAENFTPVTEEAIRFYKEGSCRNKIRTAYENAVIKKQSFEIDARLITANGKERWVRVIGDPEFEEERCLKISGSIQDIDKIKRAELEILKAAKEKHVILESIGDGFFALNKEWEVTYWNQKAEEILNCPKDRILGKKLEDVFDIENTPFKRFYKKTVLENSIKNFEAFYKSTNKWFEVNAYPSSKGLSIYFRDVTERKNSNLKLLELNKELKTYTGELVTANEGLEQFSYIISHNLRAPVANIIGLTDILAEKTYPEEVKNKVRVELQGSVQRLDDVIKDLNQILQIKHNISEIKKQVNLREIVSLIELSLKDIIDKEHVKICTDFKEVNQFTTIKTYVHSIFYNLIFNSIKFRQPGTKPVIEIFSKRENGFISIVFKDNGLGIDLKKKEDQLFKLYKRFHHHVEGKGMGLFMVKTQVDMMGGKIEVESSVNSGTTFTLHFKDEVNNKILYAESREIHSNRR